MDSSPQLLCKYCSHPVTPEEYFCPNCGKKIKDKPPATTAAEQAKVYIISLVFWPFGAIYIWRYLRQKDAKSRAIGWIALIITVVIGILVIWTTKIFIDEFNKQLNSLGL